MNSKPFITLPTPRGVELIDVNKVIYICSDGKNSIFYLENNQCKTVGSLLCDIEIALDGLCFVRCNQQCIVNIYKISEILSGSSGLVLINGKELKITRTYKAKFRETMDNYCCKVASRL